MSDRGKRLSVKGNAWPVGFDFVASLTQAKVRNSLKLKIDYPIDLGTEIRVGTEWAK